VTVDDGDGSRRVDPDDWFASAGIEVEDLDDLAAGPREDEGERDAPAGGPSGTGGLAPGRPAAPRGRLLLLAAAAVAVLLIVLAASGLFSGGGGGNESAPPTTTTSPTTTTPPTTTTTPPATTTPAKTPTAPTSPTLPDGVLKPGASGASVKQLQQALASAGHSPGTIDGVYGPLTAQAVSAFQTAAGITADGIYGPETKAALERATASG
jgi:putative peptidoglycan binding protein